MKIRFIKKRMIIQKGFQLKQLPNYVLTISQDRKKTFREISTCASNPQFWPSRLGLAISEDTK